mmetsp:Transcript_5444/g.20871  ORF Transcript_5444/g.20871 Transcript_5444/m.20871 type:complete len:301 (-) Transcript_5444:5105-6007(-)
MPRLPWVTSSMPSGANRPCSSASFFALLEASTSRMVSSLGRRGQGGLLGRQQLADALIGEVQQRVHFVAGEHHAFGRALQLDKAAGAGHHDVHVGVAGRVLGVFQVQQRHAGDDADRNRCDRILDRRLRNPALGQQPVDRILGRDEGAGDCRRAGAAVGLQHVAVQRDGALAEQGEVEHRAQRTADQALDLLRAAALLALGRFTVTAGVGGPRQHAVLGRHPALARAALVRRHALLDRGGAKHPCRAELDQHRALGMHGEATGDAHRSQLVGCPPGAAGEGLGHVERWVSGGWRRGRTGG